MKNWGEEKDRAREVVVIGGGAGRAVGGEG
jgi:hypothetical protein